MKLFGSLPLSTALLAACLVLATSPVLAQLPAATVMSVTGGVKVIDKQGKERALEKGATVNSTDKVVTTDGALVQLRLNDGGYMSIRPNTEMVIDRFAFDEKNAANSSFLVSLLKGGFRSITGLIGRSNPDAYQIRTGTATIGIRGTDHEPMFIPNALPGVPSAAEPGFYDKVNDGETFIRNNNGILSLKRGQVGFAPVVPDRAPLALQKIPEFYKVELKTDARDPKDDAGDSARKPASTGMLLRPSLTARKDALLSKDTLDGAATTTTLTPISKTTSSTLLSPTTAVVTDPAVTTSVVAPTTTLSPTTTLTTTVLEPVLTTTSTTLIAPTTTTLTTTSTLTTTTTLSPSTTLIAPTTTTTTISPTTTLIAPTTTTISPTTTTISPTTTTLKTPILLK